MSVPQKIRHFLESKNMAYKFFEHEPTPTSKDSARVRGTSEAQGAKAMILRSKGSFIMCVLPGNLKINLDIVRFIINSKSLSFATPQEVEKVTGCKIGGVPPFGNLFGIPVYVDKSLLRNDEIAFNAGLQTVSIIMKTKDYIEAIAPIIEEFAQ